MTNVCNIFKQFENLFDKNRNQELQTTFFGIA